MSESSDTQPPAKKRKWLRRLIVTSIILLLLGILINGPVARWGVGYGLNKALEAQGMKGTSGDVSGSLISGFTIEDINYTGTKGLQKIEIAKTAIEYSIPNLLKSKINLVALNGGTIILDIAKFPPSEEKPEDPDAKLRETIATIHTWVSQAEIDLHNLDVTILNNDERQARFTFDELKHEAGTNDFKIDNFIAQDNTDRKTPSQDVDITFTPDSASLDRFEVLPDIALNDLNLNWKNEFKGLAELDFIGSNLDVNIDDTITAKLTSGTVTSKELNERFDLNLPINFSLNALDATITNWQETPIPSWNIQGKIGTNRFTYDEYNLTDATLNIDQQDEKFKLSLNTKLNQTPVELNLDGQWLTPKSDEWYSSLTTDYTLKSPHLGTLVELWYKSPTGLDLTPATIDASGKFTLKNNTVALATLTGQITSIKANEATVPPLDLTANYAPDQPLEASIKADKRLAFDGSYDFSNLQYKGSLAATENDPAWLNALAAIYEANVKLVAPVNLTWSGNGTAEPSEPQTGSLTVNELHIKLPDQPQFQITTQIEYNWPKTLNVKSLTAREGDWNAATNLSWDGNTITLPNLEINIAKEQIASAKGTIPFTAQVDSLKKFLAQESPFNFTLKTQPIALKKIDEWLKLKAVNNVTGTAELDIEISGSPHKPNLKGKFESLNIRGISDTELNPIDIKINFLTEEKRLKTDVTVFEKDINRLTMDASLPYEPDTWLNDPDFLKKFLDSAPISAEIKINTLPIERFSNFYPNNLKKLSGKLDADVTLTGTPKNPALKGNLDATNIRGFADDEVEALGIKIDFLTDEGKLKFDADINEGTTNRIALKSTVPYEPSKWIEDPNYLNEFLDTANLSGDLKINTLPLSRFKSFAPQLTKLDGSITGTGSFSGTINDPKYQVDLEANVPLIQLNISEIDEIRNTKLEAKFNQDRILLTKLVSQINGGQFEADGKINLNDFAKPTVDIDLKTRYALVHRDDLMSIRANTDIKLKGTLKEATVSGTIGLAESLFYKDIELIPVGVPSSAAAKVTLPSADAEKIDDLPIPEPFASWKLDLTVRTDDPVLIRGNIARGSVNGSIKVGGTLSKPAPNGTLTLNDIRAKLPFSILEIPRGEIKFTPQNGLNPTLEIRGKSTVGSYDVSLFVYGPATSPKIAFTSYPPLPESEVMALLATGTTTSGLEDRDVATFKAFQLFLLTLKQKADKPGGNKLFSKLLSGVDKLNLKVGEQDKFTGQKYASATVELTKKWHFTAQFGAEQNTRGLIVYVIRFK